MTYLVQHPRLGFLKLPARHGDDVSVGEEYSIVTDPGYSSAFGRETAERLANQLNKKEGHKLWKIVTWATASAEWQKNNPN